MSRDISHAERGIQTLQCEWSLLHRTWVIPWESRTKLHPEESKIHHLCPCLIPLWVMSTETAALCQSLGTDTLFISPLPQGFLWPWFRPGLRHTPLHPWVTELWDASMAAAPLFLGHKLKFSPLFLVPAWAVPLLCPSCPCTMLNPTQLILCLSALDLLYFLSGGPWPLGWPRFLSLDLL